MGYLLSSPVAHQLFDAVKELPIVDYHCHLSPQEIWEDKPFTDIGQIWLSGDHYKWRLMRTAGFDERYITGDAPWKEKFSCYAEAVSLAPGHPLYHWSHMELSRYFGIDTPLSGATAPAIWEQANRCIHDNALSPRKLLALSRVETVCTTDDIADDLRYHRLLRDDATLSVRVLPSYRYDNVLLIRREGYAAYIQRLSEAAGMEITDLASLQAAAQQRLTYFISLGCRITDVGIPDFPDRVADADEAERTWKAAVAGQPVSDAAYSGFLGYMFRFFGRLFCQNGLVMQWHLSPLRNANTPLFQALGPDCGGDCVGDAVSGAALAAMLDAIHKDGGLPATVLYTLNPSNAAQMASIAAAFPGVRCGAAWWFCDHKRGIAEQLCTIAENGALGTFPGMLTDSRSFLSYARHEYFRRILCSLVGRWVEDGEYDRHAAVRLVRRLCYENTKTLIGDVL